MAQLGFAGVPLLVAAALSFVARELVLLRVRALMARLQTLLPFRPGSLMARQVIYLAAGVINSR